MVSACSSFPHFPCQGVIRWICSLLGDNFYLQDDFWEWHLTYCALRESGCYLGPGEAGNDAKCCNEQETCTQQVIICSRRSVLRTLGNPGLILLCLKFIMTILNQNSIIIVPTNMSDWILSIQCLSEVFSSWWFSAYLLSFSCPSSIFKYSLRVRHLFRISGNPFNTTSPSFLSFPNILPCVVCITQFSTYLCTIMDSSH